MFDWIPLRSYTPIYYHILLVVTLFAFYNSQTNTLTSNENKSFGRGMGIFLFVFVLLYMGTRPISGAFIDMTTYNSIFLEYATGAPASSNHDVVFHQFMKFCSDIMTNKSFFFVCSALYIIPCYTIAKKWFKDYWFYAFLLMVSSFSFWAYGTNGIRNGLATSFFLMALSRERKVYQVIWLWLAINFHSSMILPTAAFVATWFVNKNKYYFYFWLLCIPLSLALGGFWEGFFAGFFEDDRTSYLTEGNVNNDNFSSTGFRWDFLIYSATGVFAGWYYIYKKKLQDPLYLKLFNIYLAANGFWILVIRANFSNRFAYLSWFLLALVIVYPWLKYSFEENQQKKMGYITIAYFGFTYLMNVILYGK